MPLETSVSFFPLCLLLGICVSLPGRHISLVICVPLPGKHISVVICVSHPGKHISLVICVALPRKHISLVICVPPPWKHITADENLKVASNSAGHRCILTTLCKQWFTSSIWNCCHCVTDFPPCETSLAVKSEEKEANFPPTNLIYLATWNLSESTVTLKWLPGLCQQTFPELNLFLKFSR